MVRVKGMRGNRLLAGIAILVFLGVAAGFHVHAPALAQQAAVPIKIGPSGLPIPRFVSLKADRVNVRKGPSREYEISWIFNREGLPVEIIAEFKNWRQVRDSDGAEGWVFHSLLSGRRTAIIQPWSKGVSVNLHYGPTGGSGVVAKAESGVLARVDACAEDWCRLDLGEVSGWVQQNDLWGVYPGESIE